MKLLSLLLILSNLSNFNSTTNYVDKTYKEVLKSKKVESKYFIQAKHGQIVLKYIKIKGGVNCEIILLLGDYYNKQYMTYAYKFLYDKKKVSEVIWNQINM